MVSEKLVEFMRREFGVKCLKILNLVHAELGVDDIDSADLETRKKFIVELMPYLQDYSLARSEILVSELMSYLNIKTGDVGFTNKGLKKENKEVLRKYISNQAHKKIKSVEAEMDALHRLYLKNTPLAVKKNIHKSEIHKRTRKALDGIKLKLLEVSDDINKKHNISTNVEILRNRMKDLKERGEYFDEKEFSDQIRLAYAIEGYNKRANEIYEKYSKKFLENINKKYELEKNNLPSTHIAQETLLLSEISYKNMLKTFEFLKKEIHNN